jgi:hypothetical protein
VARVPARRPGGWPNVEGRKGGPLTQGKGVFMATKTAGRRPRRICMKTAGNGGQVLGIHDVSVSEFSSWCRGFHRPAGDDRAEHAAAVRQFAKWLASPRRARYRKVIRSLLGGKNLACRCPRGWPCHADELIRIANSEEPPPRPAGRPPG